MSYTKCDKVDPIDRTEQLKRGDRSSRRVDRNSTEPSHSRIHLFSHRFSRDLRIVLHGVTAPFLFDTVDCFFVSNCLSERNLECTVVAFIICVTILQCWVSHGPSTSGISQIDHVSNNSWHTWPAITSNENPNRDEWCALSVPSSLDCDWKGRGDCPDWDVLFVSMSDSFLCLGRKRLNIAVDHIYLNHCLLRGISILFSMSLNVSMTEFQSSMPLCAHLESTWLRVQFYYSFLVSIYLGLFAWTFTLLYNVIWLVYLRRHPCPGEPLIVNDEDTFQVIIRRYGLVLLKRETSSLVIYLLIWSICTWVFDIGLINSMRLTRWIIEMLCCPWTVIMSIALLGSQLMLDNSIRGDLPIVISTWRLHKFSQLLWMRYAELFPSSQLNDVQALLFYRLCPSSAGHQIPEDHRMKSFLK